MKRRLEFDEKIAGMTAKQKIEEELKFLKKGRLYTGAYRIYIDRLIEMYESMPIDEAESIGTEPELKKLRRSIKLGEEILPFCWKVSFVSGIVLVLIYSIHI